MQLTLMPMEEISRKRFGSACCGFHLFFPPPVGSSSDLLVRVPKIYLGLGSRFNCLTARGRGLLADRLEAFQDAVIKRYRVKTPSSEVDGAEPVKVHILLSYFTEVGPHKPFKPPLSPSFP